VIAGKQGWGSAPVRERLARPDVAGRARLLDYVDPADLPALYAGASVFAFPSFGEGFGFPPLEAMASGVPVVASDCSSLRENAAGAAELVAPGDTGALRAAIERVLDDESLRRRLVAAGLARAASFSWERMARETAALYSELAVRRGRAPAADGAWART
jgi:alpha-1,3-rhamnosyl/mannosyltransferase